MRTIFFVTDLLVLDEVSAGCAENVKITTHCTTSRIAAILLIITSIFSTYQSYKILYHIFYAISSLLKKLLTFPKYSGIL